jgi:hypothetical protein
VQSRYIARGVDAECSKPVRDDSKYVHDDTESDEEPRAASKKPKKPRAASKKSKKQPAAPKKSKKQPAAREKSDPDETHSDES